MGGIILSDNLLSILILQEANCEYYLQDIYTYIMLRWKLYRTERTLLVAISNCNVYFQHISSGIHTNILFFKNEINDQNKSQYNGSNETLDAFAKKLAMRQIAPKVLYDRQSTRSRKVLKGRPKSQESKYLQQVGQEYNGNARTIARNKVSNSFITKDRLPLEENGKKLFIKENVVAKFKHTGESSYSLDRENIKSNKKKLEDMKENVTSNANSKISSSISVNKVNDDSPQVEVSSGITPNSQTLKIRKGKESVSKASTKPWKITLGEELALSQLIDSGKAIEALMKIEDYKRQNRSVPFKILRCLCGCACTKGLVSEIYKVKEIAKNIHPLLYENHYCLNNYLASAYCYSGDFERSLELLRSLYRKYPTKGSKKLKDTSSFIITHILESGKEEDEQMVLKFAQDLSEAHSILHPALSIWRECFCSSVYRRQVIAKNLIENYPGLIELLPRKLKTIISKSHMEADLDLLHRTFELLLQYEFTNFYASATSALLHHQCEIGDVAGVNETLKFALELKIFLKPSEMQHFLALLARRNMPAPMMLLKIKYKFPPRLKPIHTPKFKYKF